MPHRGVILFAHGSRDPLWSQPIEAVATRMRQLQPGTPVTCAYLELTPPALDAAVQTLVDAGVHRIRVVPMFLGVGRHARQDLPLMVAGLRRDHPQLAITLAPAIGEQTQVVDAMAASALSG